MNTQANTTEAAKLAALDALTREVTAFRSWDAFRDAMQCGYVPTIYPRKLRRNASEAARFFAACQEKLAEMVRAEGFKVFDGFKVR